MATVHTPYDGSSPPFHIGVSKLDVAEWIEVDEQLHEYLAEKQRLRATVPGQLFVEEPATEAAQQEVLRLLADHLPLRYPAIYRRRGPQIDILDGVLRVRLDDPACRPLLIAASLVQEDLIIMRKGPSGWRLAAGSLSFPSSWRLREKFGRPMPEIHAAVPDFGVGSRNMSVIGRMFDNMPPEQLYLRWNWGFYDDGALYHPAPGNDTRRFGEHAKIDDIFLRVERQTLRKLPDSGDIVFTIRTHRNPLTLLARQPNRRQLARALVGQIAALSEPQLAYKGLTQERDRLLQRLEALAN
jgi:hypothetical protein